MTTYTDIENLLIEKLTRKGYLTLHTEEKILTATNTLTITSFFTDKLPLLDEIDLDIYFSYLFTPSFEDKKAFSQYAGDINESEIFSLSDKIAGMGISKPVADTEGNEYLLPLREVSIARYIKLLRLNKMFPAGLVTAVNQYSEQKDFIFAILRDSNVLFTVSKIDMLTTLLSGLAKNNILTQESCTYIVEFIADNHVKSLADFEVKLFRLHEIYTKSPEKKIFYSDELEDTYGDDGGMEVAVDKLKEAKQAHRDMTAVMVGVLGYIHDEMPQAFGE